MAGDKIIINTLERALSTDINDLQSVQTRLVADLFLELAARRSMLASGALLDTIPQSVTMGLEMRASGGAITVLNGILGQASLIQPAPPGPLESIFRIGVNRGPVAVAIPAVPNTFMILEAQVFDVVTVSSVRDVFDVPTQTFIPAPLPKQSERRIQFQIIQGTVAKLPAFSGDPWVPILGFVTDGAGQVPALPAAIQWDFRNDLKDVITDRPFSGLPTLEMPEAVVYSHELWNFEGGALFGPPVGGNFEARIRSWSVWLRANQGCVPFSDTTAVPGGGGKDHLYLAPLVASGIVTYPTFRNVFSLDGSTKGILLRSTLPPVEVGHENASAMAWDPAGVYADFNAVPARYAVHLNQIYARAAGVPVEGYAGFTIDRGGRCIMRINQTGGGPYPDVTPLINPAPALLPPGQTIDLIDMSGKIPANARTALLAVTVEGTGGAPGEVVQFWLHKVGDDAGAFAANAQFYTSDTNGVGRGVQLFEVPVKMSGANGALEAQKWEVVRDPGASLTITSFALVQCYGWSF